MPMASYSTLNEFVNMLTAAAPYSQCGGPEPDRDNLTPLDFHIAIELVDGSQLDVSPCCELDRFRWEAGRRAEKARGIDVACTA